MKHLFLILAVGLAACVPGPDPDDTPTLTVVGEVDPADIPTADDSVSPAPEPEGETAADPKPAPDPDPRTVERERILSAQQLECQASGGRWAKAGPVGYICYASMPDANRSCSASTDCRGECLAKSRTCAPISPLMGCHEILGASGARENKCLVF